MVNIREFSADELRSVIEQSIELLSQEEIVVPAEPAKKKMAERRRSYPYSYLRGRYVERVRWCKFRRYISTLIQKLRNTLMKKDFHVNNTIQ